MVFEKKQKKIFRKTGLLAKPEYPENRGTSETFFTDSLLKLNSQQVHVKKIKIFKYEDFPCPEA
jgi:hypothetical protein